MNGDQAVAFVLVLGLLAFGGHRLLLVLGDIATALSIMARQYAEDDGPEVDLDEPGDGDATATPDRAICTVCNHIWPHREDPSHARCPRCKCRDAERYMGGEEDDGE